MPPPRKSRSAALYRKVLMAGQRTVRIAAYPPKEDQTTGVTLGIGYNNPEAFAKIFFEITPENWREIQAEVKKAFAAAGVPLTQADERKHKLAQRQQPVNDIKQITGSRKRVT